MIAWLRPAASVVMSLTVAQPSNGASDPSEHIRLTVYADATAHHANASLSLPQGVVKTTDVDFQNGQAAITLPPWTNTYGQAKLEVVVYGADGKTMRTFTETLQRIPPQPQEIKAHPNGYFTCNGEWLFPIVLSFKLCDAAIF